MKEIPLTQGKIALVDDADFEWLNQWKWFAVRTRYFWYAERRQRVAINKQDHVKMHRVILGLQKEDHVHVDHKNGNGLDNRRENLRTATSQQNTWNQRVRVNNTSGFTGVSWHKHEHRWKAKITVNFQVIYLGSFRDKNDAIQARKTAATNYFGEFCAESQRLPHASN